MIELFLFIIGICFGSFLNVVIDRIPNGKSIVAGRSHCDFCKKQLAWYDLIPVVSYALLSGKCRYCHKHLSLQYPLVELLMGSVFVVLFFLESPITPFQYVLLAIDFLLVSFACALIVIDTKYHILPDSLLLSFFLLLVVRCVMQDVATIPVRLLTGILSSLPLLFIFLMSQGRAMGFGDVKLIAIMGFFLLFPGILIAYYAAFLTGAMAGVILILGKKKKFFGSTIAFGPFLLLGMGIALLWGQPLWNFVTALLGL